MNLQQLVRNTVEPLKQGRAIIFLGVGASVGDDTEQGAPSSGELMNSIATRFGLTPLKHSNLESIVTLAADDHGDTEVKRFVADEVKSCCEAPLKQREALARVEPPLVITTNYDDLYEQALQRQGKTFTKVVRREHIPLVSRTQTTVLKLHGDVNEVDRIVLTTPDYRRWTSEAQSLLDQILSDLQRYACVFIGYSLTDFRRLWRVARGLNKKLEGWGCLKAQLPDGEKLRKPRRTWTGM
jgi:hypothetical protein